MIRKSTMKTHYDILGAQNDTPSIYSKLITLSRPRSISLLDEANFMVHGLPQFFLGLSYLSFAKLPLTKEEM